VASSLLLLTLAKQVFPEPRKSGISMARSIGIRESPEASLNAFLNEISSRSLEEPTENPPRKSAAFPLRGGTVRSTMSGFSKFIFISLQLLEDVVTQRDNAKANG
jgi:hypothetical protein